MSGKIIGLDNIGRTINDRLWGTAQIDLSVLKIGDSADATWSINKEVLERFIDLFVKQYSAETKAYTAIQKECEPLIQDPDSSKILSARWDDSRKFIKNANALSFLYYGLYKLAQREMTPAQEDVIKNNIGQFAASKAEYLADLYVGILKSKLPEDNSLAKMRKRRQGPEGGSQSRF